MTFLIVTHVPHVEEKGRFFAYGPYVREMNIWGEFVDKIVIVAPVVSKSPDAIDIPYHHSNVKVVPVPAFNFLSLRNALFSVGMLPVIGWRILRAMRKADHIHLRCPGNMGLLGCLAQVFFPSKPKTAKYAGNWDPSSRQPYSYRWQQAILKSTFWTRRMSVLVYGDWPDDTANIRSFFTATYAENEKIDLPARHLSSTIRFLFSGMLVPGKNPLYVLDMVQQLAERGHQVSLTFFGDGPLRPGLERSIRERNLGEWASIAGNVPAAEMKKAYQTGHFLILPSVSEGWPKAVAEAMFWKCVPAALPVSCVRQMMDEGRRGVILTGDLLTDVGQIDQLIQAPITYVEKAEAASAWSGSYTTDRFRTEIQRLLV